MADDRIEVKITTDTTQLAGAAKATDQFRLSVDQARQMFSQFGSDLKKIPADLGATAAAAANASTGIKGIGAAATAASAAHGGLQLATAGVTRELIVLAHEAISGRFSRIPGSILVLGERMGNLHAIIEGLATPWTAVAIAAGATIAVFGDLVYQAHQAATAIDQTHDSLTLMGGGLTTTIADLTEFRNGVKEAFALSNSEANAAVTAFGALPRVTLSGAQALTALAAEISKVKGLNFADTVDELGKAAQRGGGEVLKFGEKFGIEDAEAEKNVKTLEASGDKSGALELAIKSLSAAVEAQVGPWARLTAALSNYLSMVNSLGGIPAVGPSSLLPGTGFAGAPAPRPPASGPAIDLAAVDEQRRMQKELTAEENDRYKASVIRLSTSIKDTDNIKEKIRLQKQLNDIEYEHSGRSEATKASGEGALSALDRKGAKGGKGAAGPDIVSQWQEQLHQQLTAERNFFDDSKTEELAFWQSKVRATEQGSKQRLNVESKIYDLEKSLAKETERDEIEAATSKATLADAVYARAKAQFEGLLSIGKISAQQEIADEKALLDAKWALDQKYFADKLVAAQADSRERQKLQEQEALAYQKFLTDEQALNIKSAEATKAAWQSIVAPVKSAISSAATGVAQGTQTIAQAFTRIEQGIGAAIISKISDKLFDKLGEVFTSLLPEALKSALGLGEAAASTTAIVGAIAAGAASTDAAVAASTASIVAAILANAAIPKPFGFAGGGIVPSAARGWAIPSYGNGSIPAFVHSGEMVLPKDISQGLQSAIAGGGFGGGSPIVINVSAIDGSSVAKFFKSNGAALVAALNNATRNGAQQRFA